MYSFVKTNRISLQTSPSPPTHWQKPPRPLSPFLLIDTCGIFVHIGSIYKFISRENYDFKSKSYKTRWPGVFCRETWYYNKKKYCFCTNQSNILL